LVEIQKKVPFPLWIGIPHFINELPIPVGIDYYVDNIISEFETKYNFKSDKYFFGGHSLGGASLASWAH